MSTIDFHKSTAREILANKDRVRNLINHWGEDGRYKEAVLKSVIQRFLPERYRIGSGFVVRKGNNREEHHPSKQLDIIIYDTSYPVLFKEGDFVILTADSVSAIIEVKANLTNQGVTQVIDQSNENGLFIYQAKSDNNKPFFNGIFSFESTVNNYQRIVDQIAHSTNQISGLQNHEKYCVNHIALNKDWFYKFWPTYFIEDGRGQYLYEITDLAFSFFISNLMDYLSGSSVINNSSIWFPVDKNLQTRAVF